MEKYVAFNLGIIALILFNIITIYDIYHHWTKYGSSLRFKIYDTIIIIALSILVWIIAFSRLF